jgi:hypothetical protein
MTIFDHIVAEFIRTAALKMPEWAQRGDKGVPRNAKIVKHIPAWKRDKEDGGYA